MVVMMGGRVAETIFFGFVSTGAADDLSKVTQIAYRVVCKFTCYEIKAPLLKLYFLTLLDNDIWYE